MAKNRPPKHDTAGSTGDSRRVSHGHPGRGSLSDGSRPAKRQHAVKVPRSFPLTPHRNGQFCKKIRGRLLYFGSVRDPDAALKRYREQAQELHSGVSTAVIRSDGFTVRDLANQFLDAKTQQRESGALEPRTLADYRRACDAMVGFFGKGREVASISRDSLKAFRASLAKGVSPKTLEGRIRCARLVFGFAHEEELVDRAIPYKQALKPPTQLELRRQRAQAGRRDFSAEEIRILLDGASPQIRAMILLGINCGLGNKEVALLPTHAIDMERGWLTYPRAKTGIARRCPLWPETCEAIRSVLEERRNAVRNKDWQKQPLQRHPTGEASDGTPAANELLFLTKNGLPYVRVTEKNLPDGRPNVTEHDAIAQAFRRRMNQGGMLREGRGFYGLRRSFETIGSETGHQVAVDHIMGHAPSSGDMSAIYRQHVGEEPLRLVTDHVHRWLYGE